MFIPRIGHEVIVDFVEGDPDRPIVTGRVYHGANLPPYPLPNEKTKSTIKSNSSIGGGGYNEFRFEDAKDNEEIYLHGQKDYTIAIENDKNQAVGRHENHFVKKNKTTTVGNNESLTVMDGTRTVRVTGGSSHVSSDTSATLHAPAIAQTGTKTFTVTSPDVKIGNDAILVSGKSIVLLAGGSTITMDESGITIVGAVINLNPEA